VALTQLADGSGGSDTLSFAYQRLGLITQTQNQDGTFSPATSFGWDLARNLQIDPASLPAPTQPLVAELVSSTAHGKVTLNSDGSFTYVPDANFSGTDSFTYQASNGTAASNDATVLINVAHVNQAPVLSADAGSPHALAELPGVTNSTSPDQVSGMLSFTDADVGDTHTASASLSSLSWSGVASIPSATLAAFASALLPSISQDGTAGTLAWQFGVADQTVDFLAVGETLTASYNVTVTDNGGLSATQPVTIVFTGSNDNPVVDTANSILANSINELPNVTGSSNIDATSGTIRFLDPDLNDRPTASVDTVHQAVTWQDASHVYALTSAQIATFEHAFQLNPELSNTNTGNIDWSYSLIDKQLDFLAVGESLTISTPVVIDDHHGGAITENVIVTINGANDLPVANADSNGVAKNSTLSVSAVNGVLANDTDPDSHDHLFVDAVNGSPLNVGHALAGTYGSLTLNADGSYVYQANAGKLPSDIVAQDTFSYAVDDGHGGAGTSTLSIAVFDPGVNYQTGANTTLTSGNGRGVLDGAAGNDVLIGGNGADVLIGGNGDTLTGGNGPDTFVFRQNFGVNTITDFNINNDKIQMDKSVFASVADLLSHTTNTASGTVIADTHGDTIALANVTTAQLQTHQHDFILV
jgi:VCBS repeat-containing protein